MVDRCNILDVQFSPSLPQEQITCMLLRLSLLAALARKFPTMPLSTFQHINPDNSDEGPCAVMRHDALLDCLKLFGRDGWTLVAAYDSQTWAAHKTVCGVSIQIYGLETEAATYIREHAGK